MMGHEKDFGTEFKANVDTSTRGIIPRAVDDIFTEAKKEEGDGWSVTVSVSYLQIYCEMVRLRGLKQNSIVIHSLCVLILCSLVLLSIFWFRLVIC